MVLVCGGSVDRMSNAPVAELLAADHTAFNYDRRGRGDSGDTQPYAVDREIEDIAAVVDAAGGSAFLYGTSSGAVLALKAAAKLDSITKLALWEPPYIPDGVPRPPADTAETYRRLVAEDRRGDAVEFFMSKVVGMPDEFVAQAKNAPFWGPTEALAHTLAYDATVMGDYAMPTDLVAVGLDPHAGPGRERQLPVDGSDGASDGRPAPERTARSAGGADARRRSLGDHACAGSVLRRLTAHLASPGRRCGARRTRRSGGPLRPSAPGTRARRVHRRTNSTAPRACFASRGTAAGSGPERRHRRGS